MKHPTGTEVEAAGAPQSQETPELDPRIQGAIGRALQSHYDDLVRSPVPDRFLVLLAELEAKEQNHGE